MGFRTTIVALVLAIALGAFVYFYEVKGGKARREATEQAKKVFVFKEDQIKSISIIRPDTSVVCTKVGEGRWKIAHPIETDADKNTLETLVRSLKNAKVDRVVADSTANLADFGLATPPIKLFVQLKEGALDTLCLGDKSPTSSYVFAKKAGESTVFTTRPTLFNSADKNLFDLRDKRVLLGFEKDEVEKLELERGESTIVVSKAGADWQMDEPLQTRADKGAVSQILNKLNNGRAKAFVVEKAESLAPYGLDKPEIMATLWLGENKAQKQLKIGAMKEPNRYYAMDTSRDPVFLVDSTFVRDLSKDVFDLRDKKVVHFDRNRVDRIELFYPDSSIVCQKDTSNIWRVTAPVVQKMKSWKASGLLSDLETLKAEQFVTEKAEDLSSYGLDEPQIVAKLWEKNDLLAQVSLGRKKWSQVYAKVKGKDEVYLVKDWILERLSPKVTDLVEEETKE